MHLVRSLDDSNRRVATAALECLEALGVSATLQTVADGASAADMPLPGLAVEHWVCDLLWLAGNRSYMDTFKVRWSAASPAWCRVNGSAGCSTSPFPAPFPLRLL